MAATKDSRRALSRASVSRRQSLPLWWSLIGIGTYCLGWYHSMSQLTLFEFADVLPANKSDPNNNHQGWRSIDVYIGEQPIYTNNVTGWYAQARQDELIAKLFRFKREGYFVDLAANDATFISNTFALEQKLKWNGLCIEPNPIYWSNLSLTRSCQVVAAVAGRQLNKPIHFRFEAGEHGGIAGEHFDNGPRWKKNSQIRYTVPLVDILERYKAPPVIDYLSLDVEGAESFIMLDFPWDRYRFQVITAERLRGPIRKVLQKNGYRQVERLTRWGETLWVHESATVNLEVMSQFDFPYF